MFSDLGLFDCPCITLLFLGTHSIGFAFEIRALRKDRGEKNESFAKTEVRSYRHAVELLPLYFKLFSI